MGAEQPIRVSVIIPVYDRQQAGTRALASALAQGVEAMEIVVVDDGSPVPFRLEQGADVRVRVVRHPANCGAGTARDTGVAESRGAWIAFIDSDDVWLPGTLAPRLALAEREFVERGDPMVAYAAGFVLDRVSADRRETRIPAGSADIADFVAGAWFCPGSTALLRREALARVGPTDAGLRRLEDVDWFIRFALLGGRLAVWPHAAALIEVGRKPGTEAAIRATARLRAKYLAAGSPSRLPPHLANRLEAYLQLEMASNLAADGRWLSATAHLARSLWHVPRRTVHVRRLWTVAPATPRSLAPPSQGQ